MELKRGQIAIKKRELEFLLAVMNSVEKNIDVIMCENESVSRGKKIAKEINRLTFQRHAFQHFQLGMDLKKLK